MIDLPPDCIALILEKLANGVKRMPKESPNHVLKRLALVSRTSKHIYAIAKACNVMEKAWKALIGTQSTHPFIERMPVEKRLELYAFSACQFCKKNKTDSTIYEEFRIRCCGPCYANQTKLWDNLRDTYCIPEAILNAVPCRRTEHRNLIFGYMWSKMLLVADVEAILGTSIETYACKAITKMNDEKLTIMLANRMFGKAYFEQMTNYSCIDPRKVTRNLTTMVHMVGDVWIAERLHECPDARNAAHRATLWLKRFTAI
jgi:hypothetical protein